MLSFTSHIYLRESSSADTFSLPPIRPSLPSDTSSEKYLLHFVPTKPLSIPPTLASAQPVSWHGSQSFCHFEGSNILALYICSRKSEDPSKALTFILKKPNQTKSLCDLSSLAHEF